MEDKLPTPDLSVEEWEMVDSVDEHPPAAPKEVPPVPEPTAPESPPRKPKRAEPEPPRPLEEIAAKGLFCLLCVVEAAVKMTAHATQMVCRAGLAQKLAAATRPVLETVQAAGAACAAALRRGDYRGAAILAGQHARQAAARLAAALTPVLASIRNTVQETAARWRAACPTCCRLPNPAELREQQQRLVTCANSSAAQAGQWASAKWRAVDPAGRLPAAWKRACTSRSSTYVLVVLGLGCASLAVGTLLLMFGP